MATHFTEEEWQRIAAKLNANPTNYGLPQRRDHSIVIASWNIRKFGGLRDDEGSLKKSAGAFRMIERFCAQCDLLAIQEVQEDTESLYKLIDNLNEQGHHYKVVISDVTGEAPGRHGMAERMAWLYNAERVQRGDLASDLTFDRSAVTENINLALAKSIEAERFDESSSGLLERFQAWIEESTRLVGSRFKSFVQFIRSPHLVEFVVPGEADAYEFYCVNAHLVSGSSKREREQEFFALLEWLLIDSKKTVERHNKIYLLLGDLNLDFSSTIDRRRKGIEKYIKSINSERGLQSKVNFPFLDGAYHTNARKTETYDHIAWISDDARMPLAEHNDQAGTFGQDQFDYGMFDFVQLFHDAGPAALPNGEIDLKKFEHDFSDHMPIWVRFQIPSAGQQTFASD